MKKLLVLMLVLLAIPAFAEKKWKITPDSAEEKALLEIQAESDAAKRLPLLDAFTAKFASSEALPATYRLYLNAYVETQQYDKALEVADKAFEADNEDFDAAISALRAAQAKSDFPRILRWTSASMPLYAKSLATDTKDLDEDDLKKRNDALKTTVDFLEYSLWDACTRDVSPNKTKALEAFTQYFPKSGKIKKVPAQYALFYAQQNDAANLLEWGQKAVAADPEDESALLLLAETYVAQRVKLPEALDLSNQLTKVMAAKQKPENTADDAWNRYISAYAGGAQSVRGRVLMLQEKTAAAIPELQVARKAMAGNPASLSPVLYFLGFAYAKEKRYDEARPVLQEAVKLGGPYATPSQDILNKISPAALKRPAR